ncbi:PfkB family carbohydrate kinase [Streptomyces sp. NPDC002763]|uniref:carbohydrate kinase family protein n=1 Tax=Streptomyces sp. NPDC002763 TaxID=3154427 RepID=UPI00331F87E6
MADRWLASGAGLVLITFGSRGAWAVGHDASVHVPVPAVEVVDTVGAGDAFTAGVLAHLHHTGRLVREGVDGLGAEPFTFVVGMDGVLRLAPRRSEHVACAGGDMVLSAGEISFMREAEQWTVSEVSNQSTGCCPDVSSWAEVARAVDAAELRRPSGFTHEVVFRRCPDCQQHNIVREDDFVCVFCGSDLPATWNVDPTA